MGACKKHAEKPAWGYSDCPGCEVERQREKIAELTALCDGYRGEVAALKVENGRLREELGEEEHDIPLTDKLAMSESVAEQWMSRAEKAESALIRARAEGMEEAAKIAERATTHFKVQDVTVRGIATSIRARAAKGESDEG